MPLKLLELALEFCKVVLAANDNRSEDYSNLSLACRASGTLIRPTKLPRLCKYFVEAVEFIFQLFEILIALFDVLDELFDLQGKIIRQFDDRNYAR